MLAAMISPSWARPIVAASMRANMRSATPSSTLAGGRPCSISIDDAAAALLGDPFIGVVQPAEQSDRVDRAFVEGQPAGLDPGRGVEVVDGGEQAACLRP